MNTEVINRMIRGEVNQISELSYAKLVASVSAYSAKLHTTSQLKNSQSHEEIRYYFQTL